MKKNTCVLGIHLFSVGPNSLKITWSLCITKKEHSWSKVVTWILGRNYRRIIEHLDTIVIVTHTISLASPEVESMKKNLYECSSNFPYPSGNMFKVNNRNTSKRCEICSKLIIKSPERRHWRLSGVFIINFENISHLVLVLYC